MKTNQPMEVKINEKLTLHIGHKTFMGKVDAVLAHGNELRVLRGLRVITMDDILRKQGFWEFVIALDHHNVMKTQTADSVVWDESPQNRGLIQTSDSEVCNYDILNEFKTKKGELQYAKLIKMFPKLIKSQRGGKVENRGYYMDLHLLLKLSAILDKQLEVQIYDKFINDKILEKRDSGGDKFKKLNILIDTFPDLIEKARRNGVKVSKNNVGVYIEMACLINEKVNGEFSMGWNDEEKGVREQELRETYLKKLVSFIEMGFVNSYDSLRNTIEKL